VGSPVFDWYVVRCASKNGHHEDMCLKAIKPRPQNMLTILGSIELRVKSLKEGHNYGFHPSLRESFIKTLLACQISNPILNVG
jgi:hypothetical protein